MPETRNCEVCSRPVPPGHAYCGVCGHCLLETAAEQKEREPYWVDAGISLVAVCLAVALFLFTR
jgi:hypothetical protein